MTIFAIFLCTLTASGYVCTPAGGIDQYVSGTYGTTPYYSTRDACGRGLKVIAQNVGSKVGRDGNLPATNLPEGERGYLTCLSRHVNTWQ